MSWIKRAWINYRSITEIKENLEFAVNACIKTESLKEYIRVGFLKAQVDQVSWKLENSEIDFPTLLLSASHEDTSLRMIWDGDFVKVNKEYFTHYLGQYHLKTGNILPKQIIQQGLSKASSKKDSATQTENLQAKILISKNVEGVFDHIDSIQWSSSDPHKSDYYKKNYSDEENAKINKGIKADIIAYLLEHQEYKSLANLISSNHYDQEILGKARMALVQLVLPTDLSSGVRLIKEIDYTNISDKAYFQFISACSDYIEFKQISELFSKREINTPHLHHKVIEEERMNFVIREDIIGLYDRLKVIWVFQPDLVNVIKIRCSILVDPAKSIYRSIIELSDLWYITKTSKPSQQEQLEGLKSVIKHLYVRHPKKFRKVNYGLFDMDNDNYFIAQSLHRIFKLIFTFASKNISADGIIDLIDYWLSLEEGDDGFRHHKIGLEIAACLNSINNQSAKEARWKAIQHAERIARNEEETATLLDYLGSVAECYGACDFAEDFDRVYNQLIDVAFGVSHRKDYQAGYIVTALEKLHEVDPDNTLERLSTVLQIQNQLSEAGNGRMDHICRSNFIAFAAQIYPELAFELIEKEELNIARAETLDMVLEPLIKSSSKDELPLILSVAKTLPRWENVGTRENYFISLAGHLLVRAIELNDRGFADEVLNEIKHNARVELSDESALDEVSKILVENGYAPEEYSLPTSRKKQGQKPIRNQKFEERSLGLNSPSLLQRELIELLNYDHKEFEEKLQSIHEISIKNRRNQTIRNEYYRSKSTFEKFYNSINMGSSRAKSEKLLFYRIIRNYLELRNAVFEFDSNEPIRASQLQAFFNEFIEKTNELFPADSFKNFIENEFELDEWIDNIMQLIDIRRDFVFHQILSEEDVLKIVERASILNWEHILAFIEK